MPHPPSDSPTYPPPPMPYDILHDPAVDFRAFYPYTPNEVKHRKRTTSAQLKVLETVFKTDTKPNATKRNDLAQQLDMTARGVQVWFQNRRAKEKTRSAKIAGAAASSGKDASPSPSSSRSSSSGLPQDAQNLEDGSAGNDSAEHRHSKPHPPPQLHLITNGLSADGWEQHVAADGPPDSATLPAHDLHSPGFVGDLYNLRRGSLPANVFPHSSTSDDSDDVEWFDPLSRRRSIDASLQRLAYNPYAHIARTKNSALFGPTFGVAPVAPSGRLTHRMPPYPSGRPSLPYYSSVAPTSIRRSSMDSRRLGQMLRASSPGPAPAPFINSRASLPDGNLFATSSRPVGSPIPGPLPSPNFSFGAASTPSMTSPSSADSERNSPDSLHSFTFQDREDDGRLSPVYDNYSRFGSLVSIATSESSISSSYYPELGGSRVDHPLAPELHNGSRRNSCSPGHFLDFDLDSNVQFGLSDSHTLGYAHEDYGGVRPEGIAIPEVPGSKAYPCPPSTVLGQPEPMNHVHNVNPASLPSAVPISRSSELAFALQTQSEKAPSSTTPQDANHSYLAYGTGHASQPNSSEGTIHPSESSHMYHGGIPGDSTQGMYSAAYPTVPEGVYGQDGSVDSSLFQSFGDLASAQAIDSNNTGEAFAHYP
ncbi:hypothetical protein BKA70DRAFT_662667 [Coprinopsis sp. MPI-PUGE-AT-0042]|nr:hypothetical protein BKA70DRAFT_662667 [Coprinopsis sp. MPI-PUGE-AT-0042]